MQQVYNADLANSWGNLVSRTLSMSAKYFDGKTPEIYDGWKTAQNPLADIARTLFDRYAPAMESLNFVEAKDAVMELVHAANHYIEDMAPWAVAKDPARKQELVDIILNLLEAIRISAHLFAPFMPKSSYEVLVRMGLEPEAQLLEGCMDPELDLAHIVAWGGLAGGQEVVKGDALFPRLDVE